MTRRAMRGWKTMKLSGVVAPVFLLGRLAPCCNFVRHYVAVDLSGDLHCLELVQGMLTMCVDELNYRYDQGGI